MRSKIISLYGESNTAEYHTWLLVWGWTWIVLWMLRTASVVELALTQVDAIIQLLVRYNHWLLLIALDYMMTIYGFWVTAINLHYKNEMKLHIHDNFMLENIHLLPTLTASSHCYRPVTQQLCWQIHTTRWISCWLRTVLCLRSCLYDISYRFKIACGISKSEFQPSRLWVWKTT